MNQMHRIVAGISLATGLVLNSAWALDISAQTDQLSSLSESGFCRRQLQGEIFARTELFFGLSKPDGSNVTEEEFQDFVDAEVTSRFPDGLTLLAGSGQFKDSAGNVLREGSKLLILLYAFNEQSNGAVEEIREEYKKGFQQESVLRVDEHSCVSF